MKCRNLEYFYKNYLRIYKADRLLKVHINGFNNEGIKLFTWLHLSLSHLYDDKFKHSFLDSLSPIWSCGLGIKTVFHYLLRCPSIRNERTLHLNNILRIAKDKLSSSDNTVIKLLLYGDDSLDSVMSTLISNASWIHFIMQKIWWSTFIGLLYTL